ncbi:MAG: ATP-binding cassette domain-containing protein [Chloroflexi bacterium]|nr:ATP-binding cassette domain-containing protein [Chloroflexota bacterium]
MTEAALEVHDLTFTYRNRSEPALRDVSFQVARGELVLVAGASGSGKTTLLRILNGLIPHSYRGTLQGSLRILGHDPTDVSLAQRSQWVGTVLQDPERQIIGAYVLNDVAFGLENLAVPRPEMLRRIAGVLDALDIAHLRDRETYALSGGEKQKVAVAGSLVMEPEVLLLDEPLANLDPAGVDEALALIRRLVDAGKTVLIIEHRVEDVLRIAPDKVLFLEAGEQRYFGPVEGFLRVAHPQEVKLPAEVAVQRLQEMEPRPAPPRRQRQPDAEPLITVEDIAFGYTEERPVLRGVSTAVYPGDVIALLGPNGAGKTTLVRHLIGLEKPWQGRVAVRGTDTRDASVAQMAHTVGFVFQNPRHMLFAPTVWEEFAFGPRNLGFDEERVQANVERSLRVVDLTDYAQVSPLALSFGQQRRAAIGAVLSMETQVLVLDEPTAGQDYRHYIGFMDAIVQMPFAAILFITHDLDLAVRYANRVWLMYQGQLVADGPPEEVLVDEDLLRQCRLRPTSLLRLNRARLPYTGRFLSLEELASQKSLSE